MHINVWCFAKEQNERYLVVDAFVYVTFRCANRSAGSAVVLCSCIAHRGENEGGEWEIMGFIQT